MKEINNSYYEFYYFITISFKVMKSTIHSYLHYKKIHWIKKYFTTSKSKHNASNWALTLTAIITLHQWWTIINHYHFCKILMTYIINKSHLMLFPSFYYKCAICIFSCSLHLYIKRLSLHYLLVHWYFCTADISLRISSEALSAFRLNWRRQRNFW